MGMIVCANNIDGCRDLWLKKKLHGLFCWSFYEILLLFLPEMKLLRL